MVRSVIAIQIAFFLQGKWYTSWYWWHCDRCTFTLLTYWHFTSLQLTSVDFHWISISVLLNVLTHVTAVPGLGFHGSSQFTLQSMYLALIKAHLSQKKKKNPYLHVYRYQAWDQTKLLWLRILLSWMDGHGCAWWDVVIICSVQQDVGDCEMKSLPITNVPL